MVSLSEQSGLGPGRRRPRALQCWTSVWGRSCPESFSLQRIRPERDRAMTNYHAQLPASVPGARLSSSEQPLKSPALGFPWRCPPSVTASVMAGQAGRRVRSVAWARTSLVFALNGHLISSSLCGLMTPLLGFFYRCCGLRFLRENK